MVEQADNPVEHGQRDRAGNNHQQTGKQPFTKTRHAATEGNRDQLALGVAGAAEIAEEALAAGAAVAAALSDIALGAGAAAISFALEEASEATQAAPEPLLPPRKSVTYQPDPLS